MEREGRKERHLIILLAKEKFSERETSESAGEVERGKPRFGET